jgi:Pyruvate/2-oxoacid:ferredoxin oxidoreductase delta subunit
VVMDAVYGLDKDGPAATGTPHFTGVILASVSAPALDITACKMVGFDPQWVPAVRTAIERGMVDETKVTVIGQLPQIPYVKIPDKKPSKFGDYMFHQVIMKPVVSRSKCPQGCSVCVGICKPGAISLDKSNLLSINYDTCIRCYCCTEQCPKHAITLEGSLLNHAIQGMRRVMKI